MSKIVNLFGESLLFIVEEDRVKPAPGMVRVRLDKKSFTKKVMYEPKYVTFTIKNDVLFIDHSLLNKNKGQHKCYLSYRKSIEKLLGKEETEKIIMYFEDGNKDVYSFVTKKQYNKINDTSSDN